MHPKYKHSSQSGKGWSEDDSVSTSSSATSTSNDATTSDDSEDSDHNISSTLTAKKPKIQSDHPILSHAANSIGNTASQNEIYQQQMQQYQQMQELFFKTQNQNGFSSGNSPQQNQDFMMMQMQQQMYSQMYSHTALSQNTEGKSRKKKVMHSKTALNTVKSTNSVASSLEQAQQAMTASFSQLSQYQDLLRGSNPPDIKKKNSYKIVPVKDQIEMIHSRGFLGPKPDSSHVPPSVLYANKHAVFTIGKKGQKGDKSITSPASVTRVVSQNPIKVGDVSNALTMTASITSDELFRSTLVVLDDCTPRDTDVEEAQALALEARSGKSVVVKVKFPRKFCSRISPASLCLNLKTRTVDVTPRFVWKVFSENEEQSWNCWVCVCAGKKGEKPPSWNPVTNDSGDNSIHSTIKPPTLPTARVSLDGSRVRLHLSSESPDLVLRNGTDHHVDKIVTDDLWTSNITTKRKEYIHSCFPSQAKEDHFIPSVHDCRKTMFQVPLNATLDKLYVKKKQKEGEMIPVDDLSDDSDSENENGSDDDCIEDSPSFILGPSDHICGMMILQQLVHDSSLFQWGAPLSYDTVLPEPQSGVFDDMAEVSVFCAKSCGARILRAAIRYAEKHTSYRYLITAATKSAEQWYRLQGFRPVAAYRVPQPSTTEEKSSPQGVVQLATQGTDPHRSHLYRHRLPDESLQPALDEPAIMMYYPLKPSAVAVAIQFEEHLQRGDLSVDARDVEDYAGQFGYYDAQFDQDPDPAFSVETMGEWNTKDNQPSSDISDISEVSLSGGRKWNVNLHHAIQRVEKKNTKLYEQSRAKGEMYRGIQAGTQAEVSRDKKHQANASGVVRTYFPLEFDDDGDDTSGITTPMAITNTSSRGQDDDTGVATNIHRDPQNDNMVEEQPLQETHFNRYFDDRSSDDAAASQSDNDDLENPLRHMPRMQLTQDPEYLIGGKGGKGVYNAYHMGTYNPMGQSDIESDLESSESD